MKASHVLNILLAVGLVLVCGKFAMAEGGSEKVDNTAKIMENVKSGQSDADIVMNNILTRASVRRYQNKPVEEEKVEKMLRAAMAAPTAVDKRPWHFVVVNERAVLDELGGQRGGMLKSAPLAIVICGNMNKALGGDGRDFWIQDTSAATENLLLAAHALGLGAVWSGAYPIKPRCEEIARVLNLPEHLIPLDIVVIGYPEGEVKPKDKWDESNISYNKF